MDKKKREEIHQLNLIGKLLERNGMKTDNFSDGEDPYIFCSDPAKNSVFNGVRIYKAGDQFAFRIQKERKTHPYGAAYPLPIEEMYDDFLSDEKTDELKAGKKVVEAVSNEIRRFFDKSAEAERKEREKDSLNNGDVIARSIGSDYSTKIWSRGV